MFFVVGRGRSGTSLLQSILNSHPSIAIPPEALFIMLLYRKYRNVQFTGKRSLSFYDDLWREVRLENWKLDKEKLKQDFLECERASFKDLCMMVYMHYARQNGKTGTVILGDKNPHYALFIKELITVFPEALFIHLVRDYRDTILSYKRVGFDLNNGLALAYRWKIFNTAILRNKEEYPDKFITIRFEDLLIDPVAPLRKVCSFLNVPFNAELLRFFEHKEEWNVTWRENIKKPLNKERIYTWKEMMSAADIVDADYVCGKVGSSFGYEKLYEKKTLWLILKSIIVMIYTKIYTFMEILVFSFPLKITSHILIIYRKKTGTL